MTKLFELNANKNFTLVVDLVSQLQTKSRVPKALAREIEGLGMVQGALLLCADKKSQFEMEPVSHDDPTLERLESTMNKRHLKDYQRGRQSNLSLDFGTFVAFSILVRKKATELGFNRSLQFVLSCNVQSQQSEAVLNDPVISFFQTPRSGHPFFARSQLESFVREGIVTINMEGSGEGNMDASL
jgi:hypothetical protein